MPVNRSFRKKITAKLALKEKLLSASEISRETRKPLTPVSLSPKTLDISLEPGEGRLYLLHGKK